MYLNTSEEIQQRAALLLRDVRYVIEAHFEMTEKAAPGDNPGKFQDIMRRRLQKGQFYHQPCFGCREFPAQFRLCEEIPPCPGELRGERDLGWMLYDMDYTDPENISPMFFRGILRDGVLEVPAPGCGGGAAMILQSLTDYYRTLATAEKFRLPGGAGSKSPMPCALKQTERWSR